MGTSKELPSSELFRYAFAGPVDNGFPGHLLGKFLVRGALFVPVHLRFGPGFLNFLPGHNVCKLPVIVEYDGTVCGVPQCCLGLRSLFSVHALG